jgi:TatA/E family protein of Tat protein translocase
MDFFGIGTLEIILILIVGLLIFGPQKLPHMARDISKAFRSFKKASMDITAEIEKELDDVKKEVKDINSEKDLEDVKRGLAHFKKELEDIKSEKAPNSNQPEQKIVEAEKQSNP